LVPLVLTGTLIGAEVTVVCGGASDIEDDEEDDEEVEEDDEEVEEDDEEVDEDDDEDDDGEEGDGEEDKEDSFTLDLGRFCFVEVALV